MNPRGPDLAAGFDGATRLYARIRGLIVTEAMVAAIAAELPDEGLIADLGCGIGLASLALARRKPRARVLGLDRDARRIAAAERAAQRLGITGVTFTVRDFQAEGARERLRGAFLVDLLHHVPPGDAERLLAGVFHALEPGGCIVVKEVDVRPRWKKAVCHLTDLLMAPGCPVHFRSPAHWSEQLERAGFTGVRSQPFRSCQPYPHLLVTGRKPG